MDNMLGFFFTCQKIQAKLLRNPRVYKFLSGYDIRIYGSTWEACANMTYIAMSNTEQLTTWEVFLILMDGISRRFYMVCHIISFILRYSWLCTFVKGSDMGRLAQKASNRRSAFLWGSSWEEIDHVRADLEQITSWKGKGLENHPLRQS